MTSHHTVALLVAALMGELQQGFAIVNWAEDEIARASRRHPGHADALYHGLGLIQPRDIGLGMSTEFVYRSHAAELLDRVATGADTRPATTAELCLLCCETSLRGPMHGAAAGLCFRMWLRAFPDNPITPDQASEQAHYECLYGSRIDDLEQTLRHKAADPNRQLRDIDCAGKHHGRRVACRYAPVTAPRPDRRADGQVEHLIMAHLRTHPDLDFSPYDLAKALSLSHGTIRRHLLRLAAEGTVTRTTIRPARFQIHT